MQLFMSENSPFARIVRIAVRELGLTDSVAEVPINPRDPETGFSAINPVARIPTLVLDDDTALVESSCICRHLDDMQGGMLHAPLSKDPHRLRLLGLAAGILDKGMIARVEKGRPGGSDTDDFVAVHLAAVKRGLDALDQECGTPESRALDIADIAVVTAVDWVQLRHPEINVLTPRPTLSAHVEPLRKRPAFAATHPPG